MIDYCNSAGQSVPVLHAQGDSRFEVADMFEAMATKPCSVPDWIGVVSCCNKPLIAESPLFKQFDANGIAYVNPAADLDAWHNAMKPSLIVDALDQMQQTHVLVLDALDVALNGDFENAVPRYLDYGKPVLFGATRNNSPNVLIDRVRDRDWRGEYRYLNAGTAFGRRDALASFYALVADAADECPELYREQPLVRMVFADCQDWVEFDWRCVMFQTFSRACLDYYEDGTVRVS